MKQPSIVVVILLLMGNTCIAQNKKGLHLIIDGTVKVMQPDCKIILEKINLPGKTGQPIDSVIPDKNGKFSFDKQFPEPGFFGVTYSTPTGTSSPTLLCEYGLQKATIIYDTTMVWNLAKTESFPIFKAKVTGLSANDLLSEASEINRKYYINLIVPLKKIIQEYDTLNNKRRELDSLNTLLRKYEKEKVEKHQEFVANKMGTSVAVLYTMSNWDNTDFAFMDSIAERFSTKKPDSYITPHILQQVEYLRSTSLINKPAIPFILSDSNNVKVNLSDYIGKNIILIDFWASWCGPCWREMPGLEKIYTKYKNKGFQIIGISTDVNREYWMEAMSILKTPWVNLVDLKSQSTAKKEPLISKKYGVLYLPTNFLIDEKGVIVRKNITPVELEEYLATHSK